MVGIWGSGLGGCLVQGLAFPLSRDHLDFLGSRSLASVCQLGGQRALVRGQCAASIGMWFCFSGGASQPAYLVQRGVPCGSVGGRHAGEPPGFGCGIGGVPGSWRLVTWLVHVSLSWTGRLGLLALAGWLGGLGGVLLCWLSCPFAL
ncbi:hypothetical protein CHARACLAT_029144 [Characodon lateralis]|uniref:Uncharacterized protein n=1 Tax=Characodon lateralis TaxID=208331 RepID=A0ABU7EYA4_9TELE|nr:hypothetical protein [Characodon lateralis]